MVSELLLPQSKRNHPQRLNPYCAGIWSRSKMYNKDVNSVCVLILIVLEYGLGDIHEKIK